MTSETGQVRHRQVFYLPGFDPVGPRRYRELYRREGARQAAISGYTLAVTGRPDRPGVWDVEATMEGARTTATMTVLTWSDIVRAERSGPVRRTYAGLVRVGWLYLSTGTLRRLLRLRKGPAIAALYPVAALLAQLAAALALAALAALALIRAGVPLAAPLGLVLVPLALRWFRARDGRLNAWYLMQTYAFCAGSGGATPPVLVPRLAAFADTVAAALADPATDEVLVVGHSAGAHLAVTVLADLIRAGRLPPGGAALGLLTLGQVIPMVSFLPGAERLRADLARLGESDRLAWVDVSAPGDGASFALCDPVAVSGAATPGKRWPLVISAAFTRTLSPERWRALRWRFLRLHFQYLHAFDRPGDYDFFRLTAGPRTLADRFAGRAPSASRIERPLSAHRVAGAR